MARTVAVGAQDFEKIILNNDFYIDKTGFIREWWENDDDVTLITRPRRFGKTLNMSMLEYFFSARFEGKGELFEGLDIWKEEKYRKLQGTYPVIALSFAGVKADNIRDAKEQICRILENLYTRYKFVQKSGILETNEEEYFERVRQNMGDTDAVMALHQLSCFLYHYYGKKAIILLDEYDTPLQEAYIGGYWKELVSFTKLLFHNAFKTNPYLGRAIMTGITRVSKESLFSDLNNLKVITMTSNRYASHFGFTEKEVFAAMDEFGLANKEEVKQWYDGFSIGELKDIYNPWSITNFLDERKLKPYWANTSSNGPVSSIIKKGDKTIKMQFESLLSGETIWCRTDEEMVFHQLDESDMAVWSLLLATGYLKVIQISGWRYELALTNYEVTQTFEDMVAGWFDQDHGNYTGFIKSLLDADIETMNEYINELTEAMFSSFDSGRKPSAKTAPERFYHGFVLGLLVELRGRYEVTSNRESGFGRYDIMIKPLKQGDNAIIIEFKIFNPKKEKNIKETVQAALCQIEEKKYEQTLLEQGFSREHIRKYGFAFEGKKVLIGE